MINKRVRRKCQYDFSRRQFTEDSSDKRQFDVRIPGLIQKENRPASSGLSSANFPKDMVNLIFEPAVANNNLAVVEQVSPFGKNFAKMILCGPPQHR